MAESHASSFDVVYYPQLVISNPQTLTILGLLCDRIWLPGLHLPSDVLPVKELEERLTGMEAHEGHPMKRNMWRVLREFLEPRRILRDILVLTGEYGYAGKIEPEAEALARALEEAFYGPPPPDFFPIIESGFAIGVGNNSIAGPGIFTYPANALVVAIKRALPLVSDNPYIPVVSSEDPAPDAHVLAVALAVEAVNMVLPPIRAVHPEQILEARETLKGELVPFRAQMLRLSAALRQAIGAGASPEQLRRAAKFLVETQILPDLQVFRARLEDRRGVWRDRVLDFAMAAPEIAHYFSSMEPVAALGRSIGKVMEVIQKVKTESDEATRKARELGLAYLLKLPRTIGK